MRKLLITLALAISGSISLAQTGKQLATTCFACHGESGVSANPLWPNLAGQKKEYIVKQLKAFKTNERKDPLMFPIVQALSEPDMNLIAEFFSKLK